MESLLLLQNSELDCIRGDRNLQKLQIYINMNIWLTIGIVYAILTLSAIVWIIVRHVKHKNAKRVDGDDDDLFGKTPALWIRILISSLLPLFVLAVPLLQ